MPLRGKSGGQINFYNNRNFTVIIPYAGRLSKNLLCFFSDKLREIFYKVVAGDTVLNITALFEHLINGDLRAVAKHTVLVHTLIGDEGGCLSRIIDIDTEPGTRFNYQGAGKPIVEDPNGDSCIWTMSFEIVPLPQEQKTYLMRWNPSISSFKEKDYEECFADMFHGMFFVNWSIYEWEEARRGDMFYMMRVGDDKAGIVFTGQFITDPYPDDDWDGSTKRRMYVDMVCIDPAAPGGIPSVSLDKLKAAIPSFDWSKGHSGVLLPNDIAEKLFELWKDEDD